MPEECAKHHPSVGVQCAVGRQNHVKGSGVGEYGAVCQQLGSRAVSGYKGVCQDKPL